MAMGHGGGGPSGSVANHPRAGFSQRLPSFSKEGSCRFSLHPEFIQPSNYGL